MWIVCITSVRHVLTVNGYGGRQTKENEKSWCFKGWETLVIYIIFTDWPQIILDRIFIQIRHHTCIRKSGCRYIKYRSDTVSGSILQLIIHLGTPHHTRIKQDKIKLLRIYRTQHFRQFRYQRCVTGIPPAILSYRTGAGNSGQPSRTVRSKDYSITFDG